MTIDAEAAGDKTVERPAGRDLTTPDYRLIGRRMPRHDARGKVFGQTKYADDHSVDGMLHAKVLRSAYPAARLLAIDTAAARAMPGVHAVLTARDVPCNETTSKFGQTHTAGGFEGLYRVLADKKVRYMGEAVALVAAETLEQAERAAAAVQVEYEPLPGVFDPREALRPDAYRVGEDDTNLICTYRVRRGDVKEAFATADVVVANEYHVPFGDHVYLEPESGVAWVDEDGVITIRASTQVIEHFRDVADIMRLPHNKVRVIAPMLGGGFGGKEDITVEAFLALLTWATKRPVKLTYTREESLLAHSKRHPYFMKYRTGAKADGTLVAVQAELVSDAGAYAFLSPWVLLYSTVCATGPYKVPNVKVDAFTALTNNTFTSAYRGFGAPQVCFAYELQMDAVARELGLSPLEFRRRNYLHTGDETSTGHVMHTAVWTDETACQACAVLGEPTEPRSSRERIGRGLASGMQSYGRLMYMHDTSRSYVGFELDGTVVVRCGVQDIGGGQASSLATIAAEVLGVPMEDVTVYFGDTALTPLAGTTTATRQLYMSGNATLKAARAVRDSLAAKAGEMLAVNPECLDLRDGAFHVLAVDDGGAFNPVVGGGTCAPADNGLPQPLPLIDVLKACASAGIPLGELAQFNAPSREVEDVQNVHGQIFPDFTFGTHAAEVAVDIDTGQVEVLKFVASFDVGQAINCLSAEGQLEGGSVCGLGYALLEDLKIEEGKTITSALDTYLLPTAMDTPDVQTVIIESGGGVGPFGAKGIGEPSSTSGAPAIANAVADAIGVQITQLPITPERVLRALRRKEREARGSVESR
jgi:CO/xanthine dehydrogenase Mo-binding subunit